MKKPINDMINSLSLAERKGISIGVKRGREEGREEGISIGRTEIINKLLKHGMNQTEIDAIIKDQP